MVSLELKCRNRVNNRKVTTLRPSLEELPKWLKEMLFQLDTSRGCTCDKENTI